MRNAITQNGSSPPRRGGEEEKEVSFLEESLGQIDSRQGPSSLQGEPSSPLPSSRQESQELRLRQLEAARLLKSCGVRFYSQMSKTYPPELIQAKIQEWRFDPDLGPGMLVKMIQGGDPIVGEVAPIERPATNRDGQPDERSWHERRYEAGKRPLTSDDYEYDADGSLRRKW